VIQPTCSSKRAAYLGDVMRIEARSGVPGARAVPAD
jgi:hypothetical protein